MWFLWRFSFTSSLSVFSFILFYFCNSFFFFNLFRVTEIIKFLARSSTWFLYKIQCQSNCVVIFYLHITVFLKSIEGNSSSFNHGTKRILIFRVTLFRLFIYFSAFGEKSQINSGFTNFPTSIIPLELRTRKREPRTSKIEKTGPWTGPWTDRENEKQYNFSQDSICRSRFIRYLMEINSVSSFPYLSQKKTTWSRITQKNYLRKSTKVLTTELLPRIFRLWAKRHENFCKSVYRIR